MNIPARMGMDCQTKGIYIYMIHRRNKNLHVVGGEEDTTNKIIEDIVSELNDRDDPTGDMEKEIRQHKKKQRRKIVFGTVAVLVAGIAVFLLIHLQTYTSVRVSDTYKISGAADNNYQEFAEGVLKYGRDGIAYLDQNGEEQWNLPYQIKTPFVDVNKVSAAVADKGGNDIMIFQEDGLKGEVHTTLPIEKISVSEQGIVSVILKNDTAPQIICYDTAGNILVEHKASLSGTGYPMDVAISADGELLQVIYLYMQEGKIISKAIYYNFGEAGEEKTDHQVAYKEYEDSVIAAGFFMNKSVSAVVGDNCLTIFKGKDTPKEAAAITIDKEIKSVFHNDKYIGMVLKNEGKGGYELRLYNTSGKKVMSKDFTGDYKNVKLSGGQVIMYDGKQCSIFMRSGIQKFEGEMNNNILEIFPVFGVNKYIVMNANGMEKVRLVK